jgi:hypothetical protein
MTQQPLLGQGLLIIEASRSHSDTPRSVGLLLTSDKPEADIQHSQDRDVIVPGGIRTRNPRSDRPQTHDFDCAATGIGYTET